MSTRIEHWFDQSPNFLPKWIPLRYSNGRTGPIVRFLTEAEAQQFIKNNPSVILRAVVET